MYAEYKDQLSLWIKVAFVKVQLIPQKPKKKKKKPKKKKVKEKKQEQITEKQENALLKFVKEKGISGVINILKQISKLATDTLKDLFKRITVTEFTLNVQVAGEDAADTAIKYGYCCSVIFPAVSAILSVVKYKERNVKIVPDFSDNPETKIDGNTLTITGAGMKETSNTTKIAKFSQSYAFGDDVDLKDMTKMRRGDHYIITIPIED